MTALLALLTLLAAQDASSGPQADESEGAASPYARWELGPPTDPGFFPIGVWLQDPALARRYRELGVNTFVGLWQGPTEEQLASLEEAGMKVVCALNEVGRAHLDDPTIVAWMQIDEPDNRERRPDGTYELRATPEDCRRFYERLSEHDPRRPVWLNLGQGVANDAFKGRGARPSDYPGYAAACDILSFDVYPVANLPGLDGDRHLWFVAKGLERLREWGGPDKILWNFLECGAINDAEHQPTPAQVRAEAWMSVVHGSRGIVWFVHRFAPDRNVAALLSDPEMMAAVKAVNDELREHAPVLNAGAATLRVRCESAEPRIPVAFLAREHGGALWIYSVGMRARPTRARFEVDGLPDGAPVRVLGEERVLALEGGAFEDDFDAHAVHLYRLELP